MKVRVLLCVIAGLALGTGAYLFFHSSAEPKPVWVHNAGLSETGNKDMDTLWAMPDKWKEPEWLESQRLAVYGDNVSVRTTAIYGMGSQAVLGAAGKTRAQQSDVAALLDAKLHSDDEFERTAALLTLFRAGLPIDPKILQDKSEWVQGAITDLRLHAGFKPEGH